MCAWLLSKAIPMRSTCWGKLYLSGDGVPKDGMLPTTGFKSTGAGNTTMQDFFVDRIERQVAERAALGDTAALSHGKRSFQSSAPAPQNTGVQIDRKRLAKLRRMRMAAGHKADDHEQEQTSSTMSMGW